jgi:hypothetical protein
MGIYALQTVLVYILLTFSIHTGQRGSFLYDLKMKSYAMQTFDVFAFITLTGTGPLHFFLAKLPLGEA